MCVELRNPKKDFKSCFLFASLPSLVPVHPLIALRLEQLVADITWEFTTQFPPTHTHTLSLSLLSIFVTFAKLKMSSRGKDARTEMKRSPNVDGREVIYCVTADSLLRCCCPSFRLVSVAVLPKRISVCRQDAAHNVSTLHQNGGISRSYAMRLLFLQ